MTHLLPKASMGLLLAVSIPVGGSSVQWSQWGLAGVVVGYTLWRDWHREKRMSKCIDQTHSWVQDTLVRALERNTIALQKMISRLGERIEQ